MTFDFLYVEKGFIQFKSVKCVTTLTMMWYMFDPKIKYKAKEQILIKYITFIYINS